MPLFAEDKSVIEYNALFEDLINFKTIGYKAGKNQDRNFYKKQGVITEYKDSYHKLFVYFSLAIEGNGFFKVYDEANKRFVYTRNGNFDIHNNQVVNMDGYVLYPIIKVKGKNNITVDDEKKKLIIAFYDYEDKSHPGVKKVDIIDLELYQPAPNATISVQNEYLLFSEANQTKDYHIEINKMELSSTNVIKTLLGMYYNLNKLKEHKYNVPDIDVKLELIKMNINKYTNIDKSDKTYSIKEIGRAHV